MRLSSRIGFLCLCAALLVSMTGCRYLSNRYYDFRDTFALGCGVTAENSKTGIIPPSLGLYVEATDWFQLGWLNFNGYTAELDMRGTFVGPESTQRAGFLWWQQIQKNESVEDACYKNIFKNKDFPWCYRMEQVDMCINDRPAKRLYYDYWGQQVHKGTGLLHRGWQYWEYTGVEIAISDPLLTHYGFMLRAGIDLSEVSDFIMGWFGIDRKHDDLNAEEYTILTEGKSLGGMKIVPAKREKKLMPVEEEKPKEAPIEKPSNPSK